MLYVTTRNHRDAYTAQRVLQENRGPDGGLYLPMRLPQLTQEQIAALPEKTFGQNVAEVLNLLLRTGLTGWDVDFSIGRYPVRLEQLPHRILVAEGWHNPDWNYERLVRNLTEHLRIGADHPGNWVTVAVRIAVLFGIFGELMRNGISGADISVVGGDFSAPISAWYARQWGLPIGDIICCCNENHNLWDLICHGQLRTDGISIPSSVPEADVTLPEDLERLIFACGGVKEVQRYLEACRSGKTYFPTDSVLTSLRSGLYVSVISSHRVQSTIPSVYRTHGYLFSQGSALAYAGLLDYRAKTGRIRHSVVLSDKGPLGDARAVADALGVPVEELKNNF